MSIASMTGIEEHIKLLAGRMYEKEPVDGVLEAIVSQKTFSQANLILDEEMQFKEQLILQVIRLSLRLSGYLLIVYLM